VPLLGQGPRVLRRLTGAVLLIAYPVLVYYGLTHWSPRFVAFALLCVLVPFAFARLRRVDAAALRGLAAIPMVTALSLLLGFALDASGFVLAVPVAINAALLLVFGSTLRCGRLPMIERFARLHEKDLSEAKVRWCRQWTVVWCGFFVVNGGTALVLAVAAPLAAWTVYNGLVAYLLMGLLFATEWIARRLRFPDEAPRPRQAGSAT
jgi:uncharacterized membrane protein